MLSSLLFSLKILQKFFEHRKTHLTTETEMLQDIFHVHIFQ